jgi:hypothetical protein
MQLVHMVSSRRLRRDQVEDGRVNVVSCIGLCYPYFAVFLILDCRNILIFCLGL